jgi:hypothetical protein
VEKLIGREAEQQILRMALQSSGTELIAVIGRRRVGKTFLIRNVYKKQLIFEFSGVHSGNQRSQLQNFAIAFKSYSKGNRSEKIPENWIDAFELLKRYITTKRTSGKKVVFLDEFPWIETPRSGFLPAFEHFWNSWASAQENLIVIICGSSASWMIKKILNSRGGLHNRLTRRIRLMPFSLKEAETYLKYKRIKLDRYQIIQLFMVLGGIPYYLNSVQTGESAAQYIDRTCFTKDGILTREFVNLYQSLFNEANRHLEIVTALAKHPEGLSRDNLAENIGTTSGGRFTEALTELEESGFISTYMPFGKTSKNKVFKLIDEFSFFYLKYMEPNPYSGEGTFIRLSNSNSWKVWTGFAWERICLKHTRQIKASLGIAGIHSKEGIWRCTGNKEKQGSQIDLFIDRDDHCINICEMKFYNSPFVINKSYALELNWKLIHFADQTKTRKTLFLTFITTFGVKQNEHSTGLVQKDLTMDELFRQVV